MGHDTYSNHVPILVSYLERRAIFLDHILISNKRTHLKPTTLLTIYSNGEDKNVPGLGLSLYGPINRLAMRNLSLPTPIQKAVPATQLLQSEILYSSLTLVSKVG